MAPCPRCGKLLPPDAPAGLCPGCLLLGVQAGVAEDGADEIRMAFQAQGRFELLESVGRGGAGRVFRARERDSGRVVALKVLAPTTDHAAEASLRLAREAEALERLVHPNIVRVLGHGRTGAYDYLVLEHVEGSDLRQVLREGRLAPQRALALAREIAAALEFAHARGIVHRDIKPENVLVGTDGRARVADFGLAKLHGKDERFALTGTGHLLGTLRYMAPEQLDHPETIDARADLYALGLILHEMLTGVVPMGRFRPPSACPGVPARFDEVVLHLLDRDPDQRYSTSSEVRHDLESLARGRAPRGVPGRRFSWLAVGSLLLAVPPCFSLLTFVWFMPVQSTGLDGQPILVEGPAFFPVAPLVWLALFAGMSELLARAALDRIRAGWPRLYGIGAAMTGRWLIPLVAGNVALGVVTFQVHDGLGGGPFLPGWASLALLIGSILLDAWWIHRCRARFLADVSVPAAG